MTLHPLVTRAGRCFVPWLLCTLALGLTTSCGDRALPSASPDPGPGETDAAVAPAGTPAELPPECLAAPCAAGEPCVTTVAGSGLAGHVDGPAHQAQFNAPRAIAIGPAGRLYVGDASGVRVIEQRTVTTLPAADAAGEPWQFASIEGIDVAGSQVVVADGVSAYRIDQGVVTPLADPEQLLEPIDVVITGTDRYLVVDHGNARCMLFCRDVERQVPRVVELSNGAVTPVLGSAILAEVAPDTSYPFAAPLTVAVGRDGAIYLPTGEGLRTISGGTVVDTELSLRGPVDGLAIDAADRLYGASSLGNRIGLLGSDVTVTTIPPLNGDLENAVGDWGCIDGPASRAKFFAPWDVAVTPDGRVLYVADTGNNRIRKVSLF